MKTSTTKVLRKEGKRSYVIEVTKLDDHFVFDVFYIPVIDVRDGETERRLVRQMAKAAGSHSIHMKPSFAMGGNSYQVSQKK